MRCYIVALLYKSSKIKQTKNPPRLAHDLSSQHNSCFLVVSLSSSFFTHLTETVVHICPGCLATRLVSTRLTAPWEAWCDVMFSFTSDT